MIAAQPEIFFRSCAVDILYPSAHKLEIILKDSLVAVKLVKCPGNDSCRIAPACRNSGAGSVHSGGLRAGAVDSSVLVLLKAKVGEPLLEEFTNVIVYSGGAAEHLRVSRPAETLVSLRAVRGNVKIVRLLSPDNVMVKLIYLRISADEVSRSLHIRVDNNGAEAVGVDLREGILVKSYIAEALEGEFGKEEVLLSAEHEGHNTLCRSVVIRVEISL